MRNLYRYTAFSADPQGGNPAGVWVGDELPDEATMQQIAAEVGYSETAFVSPASGERRMVRYFSPEMEVPFCGHATIATGVALGNLSGDATYLLQTQAGEVPVKVTSNDGLRTAALTSVEPRQEPVSDELLDAALATLGWSRADLDGEIRPKLAYAGALHLVIAVSSAETLNSLNYDFDTLKAIMQQHGLITLQLIWRESDTVFHSRNPFPVGGVVEDPATGAAAAALGGYLRDAGIVKAPFDFTIHQGVAMGQPSLLRVSLPVSGGIVVAGTAVAI